MTVEEALAALELGGAPVAGDLARAYRERSLETLRYGAQDPLTGARRRAADMERVRLAYRTLRGERFPALPADPIPREAFIRKALSEGLASGKRSAVRESAHHYRPSAELAGASDHKVAGAWLAGVAAIGGAAYALAKFVGAMLESAAGTLGGGP